MDPLMEWARELMEFVRQHDYLAMYVVLSLEEGGLPLPLPGDTIVAYAGYLAQTGSMIWWIILLCATAASITGSLPLYWLTRSRGRPLLKRYGRYMHLTPKRERRIEGWLQRHGGFAVFVGRMIPGLRVGTTAIAGAFEVPFWQFFAYLTASALAWWGFWLWLGATVGERIAPLLEWSPLHFMFAVVSLVAIAAVVLYIRRREKQQEAAEAEQALPGAAVEVSSAGPVNSGLQ